MAKKDQATEQAQTNGADPGSESKAPQKEKSFIETFNGLGGKKLKIKFTKSPTGLFNLGYSVGDVAPIPGEQAKLLIEMGYAIKA